MKAKEIIGKFYKTSDGIKFQVLDTKLYSPRTVSSQYKRVLDFKPGLLVAISYRGFLIPNITLDGGVASITKVKIGEEIFNRPNAISIALGIKDAMASYSIKELQKVM